MYTIYVQNADFFSPGAVAVTNWLLSVELFKFLHALQKLQHSDALDHVSCIH
jgi:hypothetical protein